VQRRLDEHAEKMGRRRVTVEHPFGTIKARMGATHVLMKTLPRVINIAGSKPLLAAIRAYAPCQNAPPVCGGAGESDEAQEYTIQVSSTYTSSAVNQ
jgi:hypothetical protein